MTTAEFLLRHGFHLDSKYLAGYGVECALKALILTRTPDRQFAALLTRLSGGRKAHDYEMLKEVLKSNPINQTIPASIAASFRRVGSWKTDLRYEVGLGDSDEAFAFFEAAREIVQWAERG